MSGPKVVRVVTREELISQGQALLARLDQSIALWKEACEALGQANQSDLEKVVARHRELEALFRSDKFQDFTQSTTEEMAFLESDIGRRRALYLEVKAREAARSEAGQQTARTLLSTLNGRRGSVDEGRLKSLELAAAGRLGREEVDKLLAQVFMSLSPAAGELKLSRSQLDLAKRLASGKGAGDLEQWTASSEPADPRLDAVVRGLAELTLHAPSGLVSELEKRLEAARSTADSGQRNMRIDSLIIDITEARTLAVKISELVKDIKLLDAELESFGKETGELRHGLKLALQERKLESLAGALKVAQTGISEMQKKRAALNRRQAVLHGLAKLGYSVNEGMSTALADAGRVVVQKPDLPGYGIELMGGGDSARLQVRTVALSAARDKSRDLDAESRWCSDFTKLTSELEKSGTHLIIERAKAVGEVALRVLEEEPRSSTTVGKAISRGRTGGAV